MLVLVLVFSLAWTWSHALVAHATVPALSFVMLGPLPLARVSSSMPGVLLLRASAADVPLRWRLSASVPCCSDEELARGACGPMAQRVRAALAGIVVDGDAVVVGGTNATVAAWDAATVVLPNCAASSDATREWRLLVTTRGPAPAWSAISWAYLGALVLLVAACLVFAAMVVVHWRSLEPTLHGRCGSGCRDFCLRSHAHLSVGAALLGWSGAVAYVWFYLSRVHPPAPTWALCLAAVAAATVGGASRAAALLLAGGWRSLVPARTVADWRIRAAVAGAYWLFDAAFQVATIAGASGAVSALLWMPLLGLHAATAMLMVDDHHHMFEGAPRRIVVVLSLVGGSVVWVVQFVLLAGSPLASPPWLSNVGGCLVTVAAAAVCLPHASGLSVEAKV